MSQLRGMARVSRQKGVSSRVTTQRNGTVVVLYARARALATQTPAEMTKHTPDQAPSPLRAVTAAKNTSLTTLDLSHNLLGAAEQLNAVSMPLPELLLCTRATTVTYARVCG